MATIADLNVNIGVSGVQSLDAGLQRASKSVGDLGRETDKAASKIEKASANTSKGFSSIGDSLGGLSGAIVGAFSVGAVLQFGSAVLNTTASFQKMEAVLTNTLGSSSQAQSAMLMIQDIAAKTPFSVEQLTESFVKLANRGITPTGDQIIKLGDLAASTGKDFDQLTEAMLDAMTGEFERLKEFGIQASASGDKVAFTFKGVTTEVAKTDTAIKDYILSLGDAQGVSGSMASISDTLGGKISNLGDNFTLLFKAIGEGTDGIMAKSADVLNKFVSNLTKAVTSNQKLAKQAASPQITEFGKMIEAELKKVGEQATAAGGNAEQAIATAMGGMRSRIKQNIVNTQKELDALASKNAKLNVFDAGQKYQIEQNNKQAQSLRERLALYTGEIAVLGELTAKSSAKTAVQAKEVTTLETLKAKLKTLQDQQEGMDVSDKKGLITKNQEIQKLEDLIKKYEGLGIAKSKASKFDGPKAQNIRQALKTPELDNTGAIGKDVAVGLPPDFQERLAAAQVGITSLKGTMIEMTGFMQSELSNAFMSVGDLIGQAFAGNLGGAEGFFKGILAIVVDFVGQFGQMLIGAGVAALNFKNLLVNPVAAIAAGVALVAISGVVGGLLKKGPGGGGGATGGGGSYTAPTNRASTQAVTSGRGALEITGETRILGNDLVVVFNRAQNERGRTQ